MLQIRSLTHVFPGPVAALTDVNLEIAPGMFGLLGPNGAGKSTLMKILGGLLVPTSGDVRLGEIDVVKRPDDLRARLGYLPQEFGFYPHLSGRQMLELLLALKGIPRVRDAADALLAEVNLSSAADRKVSTYSGGMRQRLGLAQAIAGDPHLVIVDEPTSGLDPHERQRIYRLLAELAKARIVLLSTHLVEDVAVLCPRFAVLSGGRIVRVTSPGDARRDLDGAIAEGAATEAELRELAREYAVTQAYLVEGTMRVRVYLDGRRPPLGFEPVAATLEDAFFVLLQSGARARDAAREAA